VDNFWGISTEYLVAFEVEFQLLHHAPSPASLPVPLREGVALRSGKREPIDTPFPCEMGKVIRKGTESKENLAGYCLLVF